MKGVFLCRTIWDCFTSTMETARARPRRPLDWLCAAPDGADRVVIAQFLKGGGSGEVSAAQRFPEILLLRGEGPNKFTFQMNGEEKSQTAAAWPHPVPLRC